MNSPFQSPPGAGSITQPNAAGEQLYFRSTDDADTMNFAINGAVVGVATLDNQALLGRLEVETLYDFETLVGAALASVAAGTVSIYGSGTAGDGSIYVQTVPDDGDTILTQLTGGIADDTYTFRIPGRGTVTMPGAGVIANGDAWQVTWGSSGTDTTRNVVYGVDGGSSGASPPDTSVAILSSDDATAIASKSVAALAVSAYSRVLFSASAGVVTACAQDLDNGFDLSDMSGGNFVCDIDSVGTAFAVGQIRTGFNNTTGAPVTTTDIAEYIAAAFNDDASDGEAIVGGGNTLLTGEDSGPVVAIVDRIACNRQLDWDIESTGGSLAIVQPSGGVDGVQLVAIASGETNVYIQSILDGYAFPSGTLPGLVTFTSEWITLSGAQADIWIKCNNITTPITAKYQTTVDPSLSDESARDGESSIANIDNNNQRIAVPERAEAIRLVITGNANTGTAVLDARLLSAT